jgi:hypothetical protein
MSVCKGTESLWCWKIAQQREAVATQNSETCRTPGDFGIPALASLILVIGAGEEAIPEGPLDYILLS